MFTPCGIFRRGALRLGVERQGDMSPARPGKAPCGIVRVLSLHVHVCFCVGVLMLCCYMCAQAYMFFHVHAHTWVHTYGNVYAITCVLVNVGGCEWAVKCMLE